jgi:hypothetical protein
MNRGVRIVAIVCIAVFAFTAITAMPGFAAIDAQTAIDDLFAVLPAAPAPATKAVPLPISPARRVPTSRGPPLS